jgi:hypothetical protein
MTKSHGGAEVIYFSPGRKFQSLEICILLLQDFEVGSTDPLDRMTTKQVVQILTESYLNSEFHEMALTRVREINQIVSAQSSNFCKQISSSIAIIPHCACEVRTIVICLTCVMLL